MKAPLPVNAACDPESRRRRQRSPAARRSCRTVRRPHHRRAGSTFLDRMIGLVEGADRRKTPNEIALTFCSRRSQSFSCSRSQRSLPIFDCCRAAPITGMALVALLVCVHSTNRRFGLGDRHRWHGPLVQLNVIAMSGLVVEAAGDVEVLLLDKTGHPLGNRQAIQPIPVTGITNLTSLTPLSSPALRMKPRKALHRGIGKGKATVCDRRNGERERASVHSRRKHVSAAPTLDGRQNRKARSKRSSTI